jgi:glycosyltransferase involved in cell wall biosynthesis
MSAPRVSICLPSLNTFPFLQERIDSIFGQTFTDWELVVTDSYSEDGSWELFQRLAREDDRVSIAQAPRGLYPSWNHCLRRARGEFVYVATSDDTMALDCLEKMVAALSAHADCDLAHSPLVITGPDGSPLTDNWSHRWPECTIFAHGLEDLARRPHIRRAPYDGLIHLTGQHVVMSVNQLLIRRTLFERIGYFESTWGSAGDFNWEMRAGLLANTVHVPDTWVSWRLHTAQATADIDVFGPERTRTIDDMIRNAIEACAPRLPARVAAGLGSDLLPRAGELRAYYAGLRERHQAPGARRLFQARRMLTGSRAVRSEIWGRAMGRPRWPDVAPEQIRAWLDAVCGFRMIEPLPDGGRPSTGS